MKMNVDGSRRVRFAYGVFAFLLLCGSQAEAQVALQNLPRPSNIQLQKTDEGVVFADSKGMTLYVGTDIHTDESTCTNFVSTKGYANSGDIFDLANLDHRPTCISKHPPALVGDAKPVGAWTIVNRPDGLRQWSFRGKPLYTSVRDYVPGDVNGPGSFVGAYNDEAGGAMYAPLLLPPDVRIQQIGTARVLATSDGRTLYASTLDADGKSACVGGCISTWRPLSAPAIAMPVGDWSFVTRADKSRQWAFKGKPLYTYVDDAKVGDFNGNGRANWEVALAYPVKTLPAAISITHTALGARYADSRGMTLYVFTCNEPAYDGVMGLNCDDPADKSLWWTTTCGDESRCADTWHPVVADKGAESTAGRTWSIVTLPQPWSPVRAADDSHPGLRVWAYKGRPVFTNTFEDHPGMLEGQDIGVHYLLKWKSIDAEGSEINQSTKTIVAQRVEK